VTGNGKSYMLTKSLSYYMATVKVDEKTYADLNRLAGDLRAARGRPVPIDEVIRELLSKRKPSEFIGSWKMSDEEEERVFGELSEAWNKWKQT
jgi:predicted CopG family antitoxin